MPFCCIFCGEQFTELASWEKHFHEVHKVEVPQSEEPE